MELHHLKITAPKGHGIHATVELDGEQALGISTIALRVDAQDLNVATVELVAPEIEVDGDFQVELPEETQALLKRLGWTPPSD